MLGRKLAPLSEEEKTDDKLLPGCQSKVWLYLEGDKDEVTIRANSDAAIVSGLIALLTRVYSGCSAPIFFCDNAGGGEKIFRRRSLISMYE